MLFIMCNCGGKLEAWLGEREGAHFGPDLGVRTPGVSYKKCTFVSTREVVVFQVDVFQAEGVVVGEEILDNREDAVVVN